MVNFELILEKKTEFYHKYKQTPHYVIVPKGTGIDEIYGMSVIESYAIDRIENCMIY